MRGGIGADYGFPVRGGEGVIPLQVRISGFVDGSQIIQRNDVSPLIQRPEAGFPYEKDQGCKFSTCRDNQASGNLIFFGPFALQASVVTNDHRCNFLHRSYGAGPYLHQIKVLRLCTVLDLFALQKVNNAWHARNNQMQRPTVDLREALDCILHLANREIGVTGGYVLHLIEVKVEDFLVAQLPLHHSPQSGSVRSAANCDIPIIQDGLSERFRRTIAFAIHAQQAIPYPTVRIYAGLKRFHRGEEALQSVAFSGVRFPDDEENRHLRATPLQSALCIFSELRHVKNCLEMPPYICIEEWYLAKKELERLNTERSARSAPTMYDGINWVHGVVDAAALRSGISPHTRSAEEMSRATEKLFEGRAITKAEAGDLERLAAPAPQETPLLQGTVGELPAEVLVTKASKKKAVEPEISAAPPVDDSATEIDEDDEDSQFGDY
ncbi:hypothetical protein NOJ05_28115 [Neorhizobium galegae]|nr:hypothetical protein [Neorhizobium galegae]MCQ1781089.1 hypothetical protein [Neorhizobium galegae]MCQ1797734.1 hypothetical protein [Neorhizobium galegae]